MRSVVAFVGALVLFQSHTPPPLVVHEWGTITTRHRPDGTPEGRLNRIAPADTLPSFVHRYEPPATASSPANSLMKSVVTAGRPDVTMRLETPVLYFHPPAGWSSPSPIDVSVRFRGGVLNEFYPNANARVEVDVDRVRAKVAAGAIASWDGAVLNNFVVGELRWNGVTLVDGVSLPRTTSHVWLAPRWVKSSGVATQTREGERYLFYRGVAHLDALFQTTLNETELVLRSPARLLWLQKSAATVRATWLVDVRNDGSIAYRGHGPLTVAKGSPGSELARIRLFSSSDYSADNVAKLRAEMKRSLTESGLFEDEASAMLETWRESYFKSPGLRVLYIVPTEWIQYFLPLQISVPHVATRVLLGRVDLVENGR
jgi:hypothetical protein